MADKQISELTAASSLGDNDLFAVQQGALARKLSGAALKEFINGAISAITGTIGALAHKDSAQTSYTPAGTVTISIGTGTANYTPAGTVSKPDVTVTPKNKTIQEITNVGTLPTFALVVDANGDGTFNWNQGTLPTSASATLVESLTAELQAAPTFSGTGVKINGAFAGTEVTLTSS